MKTNRKTQNAFGEDPGHYSENAPWLAHDAVESAFGKLKSELVGEVLRHNETIHLGHSLQQVANEAAGLAWTTSYPLLVFPTLLHEKIHGLRTREQRQQRVQAMSAELVGAAL